MDASVGQFQRNVGNYTDSIKEASKETGSFFKGAATGFVAAKFTEFFSVSKGASDEFKKSFAGLVAFIQVSVSSLVEAIPAIGAQFDLTGLAFEQLGLKIKQTFLEIKQSFGKDVKDELKLVNLEIAKNSILAEKNKRIIAEGSKAFENFGERVKATKEQIIQLVEVSREYETEILRLERATARLIAEEELQRQIAEDTTKSFQDRQEALNKTI